jgi:hypothetical protein
MSSVPSRIFPRHIASGNLSITGYRLGEGLVGHMDRVAGIKRWWVREYFPRTPRTRFFRRWRISRTSVVGSCRSSGCDRPPSYVAFNHPPPGRHKLKGVSAPSELHILGLLPGCPPPTPTPSSLRLFVRTLLRQEIFRRHRSRRDGRVSVSI